MNINNIDKLLAKEKQLVSKLCDVRKQIREANNINKRSKEEQIQSILNNIVKAHSIVYGQKFNNPITGKGVILEVAHKAYNNTFGFFYLIDGTKRKNFAEMGGTKYNEILKSRK